MTITTSATRNLTLLATGGLAVAGLGLAAGMVLRAPAAPPQPVAEATPAATAKVDRPASARKPAPSHSGRVAPPATQPAADICANCGVVEGVRSFERKGEGSGLGAVAGGVIGGALGNQVGKGNGRKAMTVIGAVGGGMAGHEMEKRAKSETLYEVRVRMDDGSVRTLTQTSAPAQGARVVVDGDTLRNGEAAGEPRVVHAGPRGG